MRFRTSRRVSGRWRLRGGLAWGSLGGLGGGDLGEVAFSTACTSSRFGERTYVPWKKGLRDID